MRWTPGGRSEDLEDRRGDSPSGGGGFGGFGGMRLGLGGMLVLLVLSVVFKRDFLSLATSGGGGAPQTTSRPNPVNDQREEPQVQFVSFVLDDAQNTWAQLCRLRACNIEKPSWFSFETQSIPRAALPRLQPARSTVPQTKRSTSIWVSMTQLKQRFGAPGDFAQAYVLAHEVGHHVQNVLGIEEKVGAARDRIQALRMRFLYAWNCKPTALLVSGRTQPTSARY